MAEKPEIHDPFIFRIDPARYAFIAGWYAAEEGSLKALDEARRSIIAPSHPLQNQLRQASLLKPCQAYLESYLDEYSPDWRQAGDKDTVKREALQELCRYLRFFREFRAQIGCAGKKISQRVRDDLLDLLQRYHPLIQPRLVMGHYPCTFEAGRVFMEGLAEPFISKGLSRFFSTRLRLQDEDEYMSYENETREIPPPEHCWLFAASIGPGLDDEVENLMDQGENYLALLLNAIGAGAADMVAVDLEEYLNQEPLEDRAKWRRFHIGYSDFKLEEQRKLFAELEPERIGIQLTSTCIMLPQKSVSGIAAIKRPRAR